MDTFGVVMTTGLSLIFIFLYLHTFQPAWAVKLFCFFTGNTAIYYKDMHGVVRCNPMRKDEFGQLTFPTYWPSYIGHHVAEENGTVKSSYVKEWKRA